MKYSYPFEKFMTAVDALATSNRDLRDRVLSAFLSFHTLGDKDFEDPDVKSAYKAIIEKLTQVQDPDKGAVAATLEQMSEEEVCSVADMIFEFFLTIVRLHAKNGGFDY